MNVKKLLSVLFLALLCGLFLFPGSPLQPAEIYAEEENSEAVDGMTIAGGHLIDYDSDNPARTITIPDSVTAIDAGAFHQTAFLEEIVFPPNLQTIAGDAFVDCSSIKTVDVGMVQKNLGYFGLFHLTSLEQYKADPANPYYQTKDGVLFVKNRSRLSLAAYPAGKTAPSYECPSVREVYSYAFADSQLQKISFPGFTDTQIHEYAFLDCAELTCVDLPRFGHVAPTSFNGCGKLSELAIPPSLEIWSQTEISGNSVTTTFDKCTIRPLIKGKIGSFAEEWVRASNLEFEPFDFPKFSQTIKAPKTLTCTCGVARKLTVKSNTSIIKPATAKSYGVKVELYPYIGGQIRPDYNKSCWTITCKRPGTVKLLLKSNGTDDFKSASSYVTLKIKPAQPKLSMTITRGKVKLSWGKTLGAKQYQIYVKYPGKKKFKKMLTYSGRVKSVTHKGLPKGKKYSYKIRARAKVGGKWYTGPFSKVKTARTM